MKSRASKLKTVLVGLSKAAMRLVLLTAIGSTMFVLSARAPEYHRYWLRSSVGASVYMIRDSVVSGGGTGFAIKAKSGKTFIVTNDHVCGVSSNGKDVLVTDRDGGSIRRKIIKRSEYTDLCIIEAPPRAIGLSVGADPSIGDWVSAVGHPALRDITLTQGELIEKKDVELLAGVISVTINGETKLVDANNDGILESQCKKAKNSIINVKQNMFFAVATFRLCITTTKAAYSSNMIIQGGSSGSPVVNFWGQVVGVVFAGDQGNWGFFVNHKDLTNFLKNY